MKESKKEKIVFDVDKLKKNDPEEINKVAKHYAKKELTSKQVGLIAFNAKPALDAIQEIANNMRKSQQSAYEHSTKATDSAFVFSGESQEKTSTSEEKRDAYRHAETLHREALDAKVKMNKDNNKTYGKIATKILLALAAASAMAAYAKSK